MRVDTKTVPAEMAEQCRETGVQFAGLEFGNFQDAGRARFAWTRGTFEGESLPVARGHELYDACEQIMDDAAAEEWERMWDEGQAPTMRVADCADDEGQEPAVTPTTHDGQERVRQYGEKMLRLAEKFGAA